MGDRQRQGPYVLNRLLHRFETAGMKCQPDAGRERKNRGCSAYVETAGRQMHSRYRLRNRPVYPAGGFSDKWLCNRDRLLWWKKGRQQDAAFDGAGRITADELLKAAPGLSDKCLCNRDRYRCSPDDARCRDGLAGCRQVDGLLLRQARQCFDRVLWWKKGRQ